MGVNAKIYLNAHAKPKDIMYVILKSVGHEFKYRATHPKKDIDPTRLASPSNSWKIEPITTEYKINLSDVDYFELNFSDPCNQRYSTLLHFSLEDNQHSWNNEKLLSPKCNEIWLSIGKKLVDFYGGKMWYADCNDDEDPKNWYVNKKGLFPKKTKSQDGDERWYQFQNALNKVKPITKLEIEQMNEFSAYPSDERIPKLKYFLDKLEMVENLTKELKNKGTESKRKLKI